MKKKIVMAALLGMSVMAVNAANEADGDSLRMEQLQEVVVKGVWVQKNAPFAVANIKKDELQKFSKTGKELPFLFSQTPGVLAWGENGLGTGTSYLRIRGAGDSRINVTLDGVPLNSPEDQAVFWANMNSYSALLGGVQIQRGVGTSTNGDGAFGGTVVLSSKTPSEKAGGEVNFSYGSYNTFNVGGSFSTGLLWNHLIFDGAYHETNTDGYIHGTSGRSGSYYGGLSWMSDNFVIRYKNIGNFEKTGQAWNGITAGDNDMSLMDGTYGINTGIKEYKDLYNVGLGKYNTLYETLAYDADGNFMKDANGNYVTERYKLADGTLWDKTTDNFWQNHNILSAAWDINEHWSTTASLHYTHGYGYYKEFRLNNKLKKYGLNNFTLSDGSTLKKTDFVRKNLSVQQFDGNHFGYLTYIKNEELRNHLMSNGDYQYYDSDAKKLDASAFIKALFHINDSWDVFGDMQYRHVGYKTDGYNDKFYEDENTGEIKKHYLDIDKKYDFFNPKAGVSFHQDGHRAFFSAALSHREPERNNFTDNGSYPAPKAESLLDFELGYSYSAQNWRAGATLYYMDYTDQFVQTGAQSDIGEALTTNIKDSYRMGVELTAGVDLTPWLSIEGNAALSQNKIKDFDEVVEDWDNGSQNIHYDNSTLAFSPSTILNGFVNFHLKGWTATWHTGYVSRMYLDNTENKDRSLPGYSVSNFNLNYSLPVKKFLKEIVFGANINNIFNQHFAQSGWVYSAIYSSGGHPNDNRYYQIGYVPSAGITAMGSITLRF